MSQPQRFNKEQQSAARALYGNKSRTDHLPSNWRDRLPDPATYYAQRVQKLGRPNATGWAQGACPFHEDRNASLSVHITGERGHWRCFASCGGGDLVGFHMRLCDLDFKAAVRDLIGLGVRA
ncbi:MAG TPA: CHC2 zinc finger domain-containing protein [Candidatus Saccharimonadales bacterium]|nr:CHC2 zinc finger domain-containing protein [Candidatus Saccharimonadales bacterium]